MQSFNPCTTIFTRVYDREWLHPALHFPTQFCMDILYTCEDAPTRLQMHHQLETLKPSASLSFFSPL